MNIEIQIDGPILGKWRKTAKKLGLKRLYKKLQQMESWHYRCRRMERGKGGFARIADVYLHLFPFNIHIPALAS